jgi:hypothetical protein
MRIERCCCSNAGTDRRKYSDGRHAPRASSGIAIFGAHCDAVARHANKAESFSALLRHNDSLATTDEIGIQEARSSDQSRVANGGDANAFE